jgi:gamma-glutamyltranspeptidase / glutathione hydrolase
MESDRADAAPCFAVNAACLPDSDYGTSHASNARDLHASGFGRRFAKVDEQGNVAALVHSINTTNWGATGIFVNGISVPDSASFQQWEIAQLPPGARLPAAIAPGIALKNGKPVLGFGDAGFGVHMRTIAALVSVLGKGMTPQQAINAPSIGGFVISKAAAGEVSGTDS